MKKLIFAIAILIGVGWGTPALAINFYQQFDDSGYAEYSGATRQVLGSFTTSQEYILDYGGVQFKEAGISGTCSDISYGWIISLSTTNNVDGTGIIVETSEIQVSHTPEVYEIRTTYWNDYTLPVGTYYILGFPSCNGGVMRIKMSGSDTDLYGVMADTGGFSELLDDTSTRFINLDPSSGEEVATSTNNTFYYSLNLSSDDYDPNSPPYVRIKYVRQQDLQATVANTDLLWTTFNLNDVITDGYNFNATTTGSLGPAGLYYYVAELRRQAKWWETALDWIGLDFFNSDMIVSSSTTFVYGFKTGFDKWVEETQSLIRGTASTTITQVSEACNPLTFDLAGCFEGLFGFQNLGYTFYQIKTDLFTFVPFGYITRAVDILNGTATSTLPNISYTFPSSAPLFLANANIHFEPWQYFYVEGSPLKDEIVANDGSGDNIWDIFGPLVNIIVYMSLAFMVIKDLTGIHPHQKQTL